MTIPRRPPGHIGPFAGQDIPRLLELQAQKRRDHPFLIWAPFDAPPRAWTYGEFHERVGALAAGLAARDVKAGDFLLIHLDNCIEAQLAWYACAELGAVAVTTNTRSAPAEMEYFANHCGAVGCITQPAYADMVAGHCRDLRWLAAISHDAGAPATQGRRPQHADAFDRLFGDSANRPGRPANPEAHCSVQYTSGTTARPKAVLWTHANALWGGKVNATHETLRPDDVHLVHLPLFHTNALAYSVLASLWVGATAVIQPRFSASRFWKTAAEHRCTWSSVIPFCVRALLDRDVPKVHTFRLWGSAVSGPPTDALLGVKTIGWWGMTETISHGIVGDSSQPNVPMSIGRVAPEYDIRIVDDDGLATAPGQIGNLLVRGIPGLSLFKEYLHNTQATEDSFDEHGYFRTGDRVTLLEGGFVKFNDRAKDMLKVGGENVAASEIEQIVLTVPGVAEAAVVGKRHEMLDQVPVVFVIPQGGTGRAAPTLEAEILATCRKSLAAFKIPCEVRFVEDFPRSTLEKVAKSKLRELLT